MGWHYKDWSQVGLVQDGSSTYTPSCSRGYDHEWLKADYKPDSSIHPSSDMATHSLLHLLKGSTPPDSKDDWPEQIRKYHWFQEHLHCVDGVVMYKDRIIIPQSLRLEVLTALHSAHQGVTHMTSRAESSVFWPGITFDVQDTRDGCRDCNHNAPYQPHAPPVAPTLPVYPFQCICADYFTYTNV